MARSTISGPALAPGDAAALGEAAREPALAPALVADLRTDHAGETGAVYIYLGVLFVARDPQLRHFAEEHLATETGHLALIEAVVPPPERSRLIVAWRVAGWFTGALPALFGPRAVYATIAAVEAFVDRHYAAQIRWIDATDPARADVRLQSLRTLLERCRQDEVSHHDQAVAAMRAHGAGGRVAGIGTALLAGWARIVAAGSAGAVALSRRL